MTTYIIKLGKRISPSEWESWQYIGPFISQRAAINYYDQKYPHAQTDYPDWVVEELSTPNKRILHLSEMK